MSDAKPQKKMTLLHMLRLPTPLKKSEKKRGEKANYFNTCSACGKEISHMELSAHFHVCPQCGHHNQISARARLRMLADEGSLQQLPTPQCVTDPLGFSGYPEKLNENKEKTGLEEAAVAATLTIDGRPAVVTVLDSRFLMGSMGVVVGEIVTRAVEYAAEQHLPMIIFSASGGARMQEGILSLMQMAKTSAALARFAKQGGLYISYLTNPTTGGVSASFAGLGDITLAEPGALIGFAGPRVIEQTIRQKLPEGFQRAEFQEEHGFVDRIVPRDKMRSTLALLLRIHQKEGIHHAAGH